MGKCPGLRLQTEIIQDNIPTEIIPGLFIGSVHAAFNIDALRLKKITHILNMSGKCGAFPEEFVYFNVRIRDKESSNLLSCLPILQIFIEAGRRRGGILVHCTGGRSRSPAVIVSYLMSTQRMSYEKALRYVRMIRPVTCLNSGFEVQVKLYEKAHCDAFAAHQLLLQYRLSSYIENPGECAIDVKHHRLSPNISPQDLPAGFSLSIPGLETVPYFIPPLRSMATLFGCKGCGQALFSSGNIIAHCAETKVGTISSEHFRDLPSAFQIRRSDHSVDGVSENCLETGAFHHDHQTLAKLRLQTTTPMEFSDSLLTKIELKCEDVMRNISQYPSSHVEKQRNIFRILNLTKKFSEIDTIPTNRTRDKVRRLFASIKSSRSISKDSAKEKNGREFQRKEDTLWQSNSDMMMEMKHIGSDESRSDLAEMICADSQAAKQIDNCDFFIEPADWLLRNALASISGSISCPNISCKKLIGNWSWEGISCKCGGFSAPGFLIRKDVIQRINGIQRPNSSS